MKEFKLESVPNLTFRIKKMNGIEALATRQLLVQMKDGELEKAYNTMLEKYIEVQIDKDVWQKCKIGNNYYPKGLEDNVNALTGIMNEFANYVSSFFLKSNA